MEEFLKAITESIESYINKAIARVRMNHTTKAIVTEVLSNNKYKVQIDGKEHTATGCCSALLEGDIVYAIICNNDYKNIILLKAGG